MKKIFAVLIAFFIGFNAHSSPRRFNQYIWNNVPGMYYHRVLAQVSIPENPNGTVVIICPGGSYHHLDILNEGLPTQKWFNTQGATAIILRYRTANRGYHYPAMMDDVHRMVDMVREQPERYGANEGHLKLGLIGYSAGGHLVTWAGANLHTDFVIPVYPVVTMQDDIAHRWSRNSLLGHGKKNQTQARKNEFSMELNVPDNMPPTYVVVCKDDPVVIYENSFRLYDALLAKNIPSRLAVYEWGGHGFGMKDNAFMKKFHWNEALKEWLVELGFME